MGNTYKTILIEDEQLARGRLKSLLSKYEDTIEIVAECDNGRDGLAKINSLKPDVVFLDIAMPGLNGFEILKNANYMPLVIFTTAFDQYAIKAFEENSIDYLLKPINEERLEKALNKLFRLKKIESKIDIEQLEELSNQLKNSSKNITFIPVKVGNKILLIKLTNITHFEAKDKAVYLYTNTGNEYIVDLTIASLETKLPDEFVRVHRAYIINFNQIQEIRKDTLGAFLFRLEGIGKTEIKSGINYHDNIKAALKI